MQTEIKPFSDNLDERGLGWHFFSLGDPSAKATNSLGIGGTSTGTNRYGHVSVVRVQV